MSFQAPIGTVEERASGLIWPGGWSDATPYLTHYSNGIHTGADLNLNKPGAWDADAHAPVYAIGDGVVTYARRWPNPKYWGKIVVIDHGLLDGKPLFTRCAHVETILVTEGQKVRIGDQVATVGNGDGLFPYHLHFDISTTDVLRSQPNHWPSPRSAMDERAVREHYVDPKRWLQEHFAAGTHLSATPAIQPAVPNAPVPSPVVTPTGQVLFIVARDGVFVRDQPGTSGARRGSLLEGARVSIEDTLMDKDDYTWARIGAGEHKGCWFAIGRADKSDIFVSTNPPVS